MGWPNKGCVHHEFKFKYFYEFKSHIVYKGSISETKEIYFSLALHKCKYVSDYCLHVFNFIEPNMHWIAVNSVALLIRCLALYKSSFSSNFISKYIHHYLENITVTSVAVVLEFLAPLGKLYDKIISFPGPPSDPRRIIDFYVGNVLAFNLEYHARYMWYIMYVLYSYTWLWLAGIDLLNWFLGKLQFLDGEFQQGRIDFSGYHVMFQAIMLE